MDVPISELPPGTLLGGRYRIERLLGKGGMGAVYAATHDLTGRRVAIKWMLPTFAADERAVLRFMREARSMGRIEHPNVIEVLDVDREGSTPFLVMELLHGEPLSVLVGSRPVPADTIVEAIMPALRGVAAAHEVGVVHRDLKPDNVFLCHDARGMPSGAKVLDFGISKPSRDVGQALTLSGVVLGTPRYMAPEQLMAARDTDARCDVYALGVILYQALTGVLPPLAIQRGVEPLSLRAHVPSIDPALDAVVQRAMAFDAVERFPDVASLGRALEPFGRGARFEHRPALRTQLPLPKERSPVRRDAPTIPMQATAATAPAQPMVIPATRPVTAPRAVWSSVAAAGVFTTLAAIGTLLVLVVLGPDEGALGPGAPPPEHAAEIASRRAALPPARAPLAEHELRMRDAALIDRYCLCLYGEFARNAGPRYLAAADRAAGPSAASGYDGPALPHNEGSECSSVNAQVDSALQPELDMAAERFRLALHLLVPAWHAMIRYQGGRDERSGDRDRALELHRALVPLLDDLSAAELRLRTQIDAAQASARARLLEALAAQPDRRADLVVERHQASAQEVARLARTIRMDDRGRVASEQRDAFITAARALDARVSELGGLREPRLRAYADAAVELAAAAEHTTRRLRDGEPVTRDGEGSPDVVLARYTALCLLYYRWAWVEN